jgi:hypothetical protein
MAKFDDKEKEKNITNKMQMIFFCLAQKQYKLQS